MLAERIHRGAQEVGIGDAADRHRVLEGQEYPLPPPLLWLEPQEVFAEITHGPGGNLIGRVAGQHLSEGALPGAVRPHDGVDLAHADPEVDSLEDLVALHGRVEV